MRPGWCPARARRPGGMVAGMTGSRTRTTKETRVISEHEAAEVIRRSRARLGQTWQQLAEAINKPVAWTTAALLGQHPMGQEDAETIGALLDLDEEVVEMLQLQ